MHVPCQLAKLNVCCNSTACIFNFAHKHADISLVYLQPKPLVHVSQPTDVVAPYFLPVLVAVVWVAQSLAVAAAGVVLLGWVLLQVCPMIECNIITVSTRLTESH